ncbi:MAG: aspartate/glutamate racemase family protein [Pseudomonadota bacterium]
MRVLGLIGGMSWESSELYYRAVNKAVSERLGGFHSAALVMSSIDFEPVETLQRAGDWDRAGHLLANEARRLQRAGAECIVLCTNTMHIVSDAIEAATELPFLHIADAAATAISRLGVQRVGLLGTRFTMEQAFYRDRLATLHGIDVLVPDTDDRAEIDRVIFEELCHGKVLEASRANYLKVVDKLAAAGAEAVVLGCTEIGMLVGAEHTTVPLIDTTAVHAAAAVEFALNG